MNNTKSHAKRELEILLKTMPKAIIRHFVPELIALCEAFGNSGQSGGSAPYTAGALAEAVKKLCLHQVIAPITGEDDEWNDVGETLNKREENDVYQNNRQSNVFKKGKNGRAYFLDAIVWQGQEEYDAFTGSVEDVQSRQYIKSFPFRPKTFYIDVVREKYNKEKHGNINYVKCNTEDFVYTIKDRNQLKEVFEYYDEY